MAGQRLQFAMSKIQCLQPKNRINVVFFLINVIQCLQSKNRIIVVFFFNQCESMSSI